MMYIQFETIGYEDVSISIDSDNLYIINGLVITKYSLADMIESDEVEIYHVSHGQKINTFSINGQNTKNLRVRISSLDCDNLNLNIYLNYVYLYNVTAKKVSIKKCRKLNLEDVELKIIIGYILHIRFFSGYVKRLYSDNLNLVLKKSYQPCEIEESNIFGIAHKLLLKHVEKYYTVDQYFNQESISNHIVKYLVSVSI